MIRNYLKIAWRNLKKNGLFSIINVFGLSAGILFSLLIGAYIWGELQINKNLKNATNQYILTSKWKTEGMGMEITTLGPIAKRLLKEYPNLVANYYRWDGITSVVSKGDKNFRQSIQLGDSTILSMYGFELLVGNAKTALLNPYSMVITEDLAVKYFGKIDVLGQSMNIQGFAGEKHDFVISGVLKVMSENSVTQLLGNDKNTIFIPNNTAKFFGRDNFENWSNTYIPSYVQIQNGVSVNQLKQAINQLIARNAPDFVKSNLCIIPIPLNEFYLEKNNGLVKKMLMTLSLIGFFILLMAIINFINISISSSSSRSKEIGVRKSLGGFKSELVFQFMTESFILVFISAVLSLFLYPLFRPIFNEMIGKSIPQLLSLPSNLISYFAGFILTIGTLAGLYPALVLSAHNTLDSLKGKIKTSKSGVILRKSLTSFQFATSLIVLIGATIVTKQVNHFFGKNLGYNKEFVLSVQVPRDWTKKGVRKIATIREEFEKMKQIEAVSLSYEIPNGNNGGQSSMYKLGSDSMKTVSSQALVSDHNYIKTYQIPLKVGRFFENMGSDSAHVVLNEKSVNALAFKNSDMAIGQKVRFLNDPILYTIIGVTKDFQFGTMQEKIQPMVFFDVNTANIYRFLSFKIRPSGISESIAAIQTKWINLIPESAFEYSFMDDSLEKIYQTEIQMKKAAYVATILAIIISLLGVTGLVALSIQKRIKEIGVRKVLGASPFQIIVLFLNEFASVFVLACLVACPLALFLMNKWLNNYANRIEISPISIVWLIAAMMIGTSILIGFQTLKAALMNPVKSLKTE